MRKSPLPSDCRHWLGMLKDLGFLSAGQGRIEISWRQPNDTLPQNTDVTWNLSLVQSENERKAVVHKEERRRNRNFVRCNEMSFWLQQAFWFPNILRMYSVSNIPGRRIFLCDVELGFGEHEFSGRRMSYCQRILQARLSWVISSSGSHEHFTWTFTWHIHLNIFLPSPAVLPCFTWYLSPVPKTLEQPNKRGWIKRYFPQNYCIGIAHHLSCSLEGKRLMHSAWL